MKAGSIALAAIVSLAAAQPHANLHEQHHNNKRQATEIKYVTAQDAVVYVDSNGNPISTHFNNPAPATAAPAPAVQSNAPVKAAYVPQAAPKHYNQAAEVKKAPTYSSNSGSESGSESGSTVNSGNSNSGLGIAYSPYNADGSCKTSAQVSEDFGKLGGYSVVRTYGVDCDQVSTVGAAAKAKGMKLFAGIFHIDQASSEASTIVSAVKGDWSLIDTVSVGNELLNQHSASASDILTALNAARSTLKAGGYSGPVVYVDTFNAMIAQNEAFKSGASSVDLCSASDYSAANAHPFFAADTAPSESGSWMKGTIADIAASCPGKRVRITETGYPHAGSPNGAAVPSSSNQATAVGQIKSVVAADDLILFSAFNDLWKVNAAYNFYAEQSYGLYGNCPSG